MIRRPPRSTPFPTRRSSDLSFPNEEIERFLKKREAPYVRLNDDELIDRVAEQLARSEEHTSELQSQSNLVCRLLLEKKKKHICTTITHSKTLDSPPLTRRAT